MRSLSTPTEEEPKARKKAKIVENVDNNDNDNNRRCVATAFQLYRNHLLNSQDDEEDDDDSHDDGNNDNGHCNDLSQIENLVQLLDKSTGGNCVPPFDQPLSSITNETDMVGILASVAYCLMATSVIEQYLAVDDSVLQQQQQTPQDLIDKSLFFFPMNAACRSIGANFGRITETLSATTITEWYQQAAEDARRIRRQTLDLLDRDDIENSTKEWIELLLLHQVVGVEYVVQEDEKEDDDDDNQNNEQVLPDDHNRGYFSSSSVEGTCRFMAAILLSRDNHHDAALRQLQYFPLTHRLHPNAWTGRQGDNKSHHEAATTPCRHTTTSTASPVSFHNVLPPELYEQMCNVFGPDASFWKESDYANRGYYSFLTEISDEEQQPKNLIDEVVLRHLLPLAKQFLSNVNDSNAASEICAYEWWAHSRQASLGHAFHFDTDEANLGGPSDTVVHHPLLSSVLYLTGDETSGATILLDQTPDSDGLAQVCWRSVPRPNTFMVFPGNLLHGVLPCRQGTDLADEQQDTTRRWIQQKPTSATSAQSRRLTFMVGFKTRRVPDQRQGQCMYGPCAPIPPEASQDWVRDIHRGYNEPLYDSTRELRFRDIEMLELPHVAPAFEVISPTNGVKLDDGTPLEVPLGIDQRFFVNGAPECFRTTLFENDDD